MSNGNPTTRNSRREGDGKGYWHFNPNEVKLSLVQVGSILLALGVAIGYAEHRLSGIEERATRYQWTVQDQVRWSEQLQWRNPEIKVPDAAEMWEWQRSHTSRDVAPQYLTPWTRREMVMDNPKRIEAHP